MKKLKEFEKWMEAGKELGATYDRMTAWASWSVAWDSAISDAASAFWNHPATIKEVPIGASQEIMKAIRSLSD